jgi:lipopolysaccharide biosynthesis protein
MEASASRKVCLFAQFDPQHRIRQHVLDYLVALKALGFEVVVACSGEESPPIGDRDALYETGSSLVLRANRGFDFGAWQDLIGEGYAEGAETVLLANDSVFGPFADLSPIVGRMCARQLDVWGMVESVQFGWHLQSWFLHFSSSAFAAPAIRRVFDQPFEKMTKQEVIRRGELALGVAIRKEGLRCDAVVRRSDGTWLSRIISANPMHINWRHLLVTGQLPFIKADLLRDNPLGIPWVTQWVEVLSQTYGTSVEHINGCLYAYAGTQPESAGWLFPTPTKHRPLWVLLVYAMLSRDHGAALRALAARLRAMIWRDQTTPAATPVIDAPPGIAR